MAHNPQLHPYRILLRLRLCCNKRRWSGSSPITIAFLSSTQMKKFYQPHRLLICIGFGRGLATPRASSAYRRACRIIIEEYDGIWPQSAEGLILKLPGIWPSIPAPPSPPLPLANLVTPVVDTNIAHVPVQLHPTRWAGPNAVINKNAAEAQTATWRWEHAAIANHANQIPIAYNKRRRSPDDGFGNLYKLLSALRGL